MEVFKGHATTLHFQWWLFLIMVAVPHVEQSQKHSVVLFLILERVRKTIKRKRNREKEK